MIAILLALLAVVNVTTPSVTYSCDGSTAVYLVNFPYLSSFDLKVTSTTPAGVKTVLAQTTDWSVDRSSTSSTATLTLTSPATKCSAGSVLKIANDLAYTQPSSFRAQTVYNQALHEQSYDRATMQIQKLATTTASADSTGVLTTADWQRFNSAANVVQLQATGTTTDFILIQTAINAGAGTVNLGASGTCFNLGTSSLNISTGVTVTGQGMGSPGNGATCITYNGTGCAIIFDSTQHSGLANVDVHLNSASATAAAVCERSTTGVAEFNRLENLSLTADQVRVVGQVGLSLLDNSHGIFWNTHRNIRFKSWDRSMVLTATGTTQGVNSNYFSDLMSYAHNTAYQLRAGAKQVTDNRFFGLTCSRSDGTQLGATACLMMGDDNVAGVFGNAVFGLANDSGSPDTCGTLGTNAGANLVIAACESGGGFQDTNTTGTFPNSVWNQLGLGSLTALLSVGVLISTKDARLIATTVNGQLGTGPSGAGGVLSIAGGVTGAAGQPGGDLQLQGGSGAPQANSGGGNVIVKPGPRNGTGLGGYVQVGPAPGLSANSGVRIASGRITIRNSVFTPVDCAGAGVNPTVSTLLEGTIFTCGTAQTLTLPTAQGSTGIVQAMAGTPTVGDIFRFRMSSTAAANFTLAGGAGITIVGNAVVNNTKVDWECRVTLVVANSETITCY